MEKTSRVTPIVAPAQAAPARAAAATKALTEAGDADRIGVELTRTDGDVGPLDRRVRH